MSEDSHLGELFLEEVLENTDDLIGLESNKDHRESLKEVGIDVCGVIVTSMVEDEFENLYATLVTRSMRVLSVHWDLSKTVLFDGIEIDDVTNDKVYYEIWPQTIIALSLQKENCQS